MLDLFFKIIHVISNMVGMCIEACRTNLNNHPNHVLFWIENENHKYVVVLLLHYQHLLQFIICIPSSVYFRPMSPSQFLHHVLLSLFCVYVLYENEHVLVLSFIWAIMYRVFTINVYFVCFTVEYSGILGPRDYWTNHIAIYINK